MKPSLERDLAAGYVEAHREQWFHDGDVYDLLGSIASAIRCGDHTVACRYCDEPGCLDDHEPHHDNEIGYRA